MEPTSIGLAFGSLSAILGLLWLITRITGSFKDRIQKDYDQKIQASEKDFENKIAGTKEYIDLRHNEALREISHIREVQGGRLKELSEKIDELREQIAAGQKQTMDLLTKLLIKDD